MCTKKKPGLKKQRPFKVRNFGRLRTTFFFCPEQHELSLTLKTPPKAPLQIDWWNTRLHSWVVYRYLRVELKFLCNKFWMSHFLMDCVMSDNAIFVTATCTWLLNVAAFCSSIASHVWRCRDYTQDVRQRGQWIGFAKRSQVWIWTTTSFWISAEEWCNANSFA